MLGLQKLIFDYEQLTQQLEMERQSSGVEGRKLTGKARKIELLMESNKDNLKRISDANAELRKKDEIIAAQEQLTKKYIREKEALMADTMAVNHEVGRQRSRNQELRGCVQVLYEKLRQEQTKSSGVHTLSLGMVHAFCLRAGMDATTLGSTVPANFMDMWMCMSKAIVLIQSAFRGTLRRMKLVERFGRGMVVSWAERQDLDNKLVAPSGERTAEDYENMGLSPAHALKAVSTNMRTGEKRLAFEMPSLMTRFPATSALAELIKFSPKDQYKWVDMPQYLAIVKAEVCRDLKQNTEQDLATMKEEMVRYGCRLLRQVTVKTKETRPQAVQAGAPVNNLKEFEFSISWLF